MKRIFPLGILLLFLFACYRKEFAIKNLNGDEILCLGHGGMGTQFKYPIDSYESIEPCLRIGADGTEIDIQMSKDSVLVAFHNETLGDWASCEGKIHEKLWTEIDGCKFSSPYSSQIYIMSLENLLNRLKSPEKYYFSLDCKIPENANKKFKEHFANAIIKIAKKFDLENKLFIESRDREFLLILKQKKPNYKLFPIIYLPDSLQKIKEKGFFGISIDNRRLTKEKSEEAHSVGLWVIVWNVDSKKENIKAIEKNPDIIQSDKIIHLLKLFGKYKK